MRLTRMIVIAAVAAIASMAFVGVSSAMAEDTEVVMCTKFVKLCATEGGSVLPAGTKILAFNEGKAILHGALSQECETSEIHGPITSTGGMGNPLVGSIETLTFEKNCTPCSTVKMEKLPYVTEVRVSAGDVYSLVSKNVLAALSHCTFFNLTCNFTATEVAVEVKNSAEGSLVSTNKAPLTFESGTGGKSLCGETGTWEAAYKIKCDSGGVEISCWPSLELLNP